MDSAWQNHNPGDNTANNIAFSRLKMVVEFTRVDIDEVLKELNETIGPEISYRILRTSNAPDSSTQGACPEPYTSLRQFHPPAMPFTHPNPLRAQRPDQSTQVTAFGQGNRATVRNTPTPSSGTGNRRQPEVEPVFIRPARRQDQAKHGTRPQQTVHRYMPKTITPVNKRCQCQQLNPNKLRRDTH